MISVSRIRTILTLALPVTVGLLSSFVMAMIDLAMVGRMGSRAIGAVGLAGFSYSLLSAAMTGIIPAVQGCVSRRIGEGSTEPRCRPLNAGLMLALAIGLPLSVLCYGLTAWYFTIVSPDPGVIAEGVPYLRALFIGLTATGLDNAFQGHWAGMGRTKVYMLNVLGCNALHVALNYVLIFGHFGFAPFGTEGAGVATTISVFCSTLVYFVTTLAYHRHDGFLAVRPRWGDVLTLLQIGIPAMLETMFFSLGFLVYYWIIGRMGTAVLAASSVVVRISIITDLFGQALSLAAITLVQRALGEGNAREAERWGWDIAKMGVVWITLLGLPVVVFPRPILALFLTDPTTLAMAVWPARLTASCLGLASLITIFAYTLVSLGDGKRVMLVSFTMQWLVYLPAVWAVGVMLHGALIDITFVQLAYGGIAATLIMSLWIGGRWKAIRL